MRRFASTVLIAAGFLMFAGAAWAQGPRPTNAFQFRMGGFFPKGGDDLWDANEQEYTLDVSDFNDFVWGMSYVMGINNNVELGFNVDFYRNTVLSADLNYIDDYGFYPQHDTRLEVLPMTVDLRFLPAGRYGVRGAGGQRRVLQPVPYLGAGIGFDYWEYEEVGDFAFTIVPPPPPPDPSHMIDYDRFVDSGTAFEMHLLAGVELPMSPTWGFLLEGRYSWAEADVGSNGAYYGPGKLDLSGLSIYGGFSLRF